MNFRHLTKMIKYFFILIISLAFIQTVYAQQPSVVWDENTKSWVSVPNTAQAPASATTTTTVPQQTQQIPLQQQQQQQQPQIIQTIPTTPGNSTVDLGTLMAVITPILAGLGGIFLKNKKDLEKNEKETEAKDKKVREQTIEEIKAAILPTMKQIAPVAELSSKQSIQINQLAEAFYDLMADRANEIHDKPEIKKANLVEDVVKSKIIAEQAKNGGSVVWDEVKKEWVSK